VTTFNDHPVDINKIFIELTRLIKNFNYR
jgi:hypothetical protein